MKNARWSRRHFLQLSAGSGFGTMISPQLLADDPTQSRSAPPRISNPRATSGDKIVEPDWEQRLTIKVGQQQGDLIGSSQKVLQAAVD